MKGVIVFNATFNNISFISWRESLLLVQETGVPGENNRPAASHGQTLSHNVGSSTPRMSEIRTHNISGDRHSKWIKEVSTNNSIYQTDRKRLGALTTDKNQKVGH